MAPGRGRRSPLRGRERWREIDALLTAALELPPAERLRFVRDRTAGDGELARAVEELLRAGDEAASFLERPIDLDSAWPAASDDV